MIIEWLTVDDFMPFFWSVGKKSVRMVCLKQREEKKEEGSTYAFLYLFPYVLVLAMYPSATPYCDLAYGRKEGRFRAALDTRALVGVIRSRSQKLLHALSTT
jgi:hypothetical protein